MFEIYSYFDTLIRRLNIWINTAGCLKTWNKIKRSQDQKLFILKMKQDKSNEG